MRAIPGPGGERAPRIAAARAHLGNGEWLLATAVQPTGDQPRDDDKPKRRIRRDVFGAFRPPPTWDTDIQRVEYVMPPPELAARGLRTGVMMLAGGIDEDATWQAQREHDRQYGTGRHAPKCKLVRWSKDMPYTAAWEKESIDLNSAERKFSIIIDIDDEDAQHRLLSAIADHLLPAANWFVRRKEGGKGHAVWVLAEPLHTGPGARLKPQQAAYCVFQYFCEVLGGDTRYLQRQTHNPVYKGKRAHEYEVFWMATTPYSLKELLTWLPDDWQPAPRAKRKKRGGSQALYIDGMKWAGRWANRDLPAIEELERLNDSYDTPATDEIVEALAEHIEAERNVWRTRPEGWHSAEFLALQAARGRKGGLASGQSRDRRNAERDENIADYIAEGHTQAQAARHFGYSQSTICKAVKAHRRRSDEQKRTTAPPETAPPPRETRRIDEANDPPPKGESSPFPSSSPVCVSDRARDSQDRARLRRGGGRGGGRSRQKKRPETPVRSQRTALGQGRRSDVRRTIDFGDLATPAKPVATPPRTPDPPIDPAELDALRAAVERKRAEVTFTDGLKTPESPDLAGSDPDPPPTTPPEMPQGERIRGPATHSTPEIRGKRAGSARRADPVGTA